MKIISQPNFKDWTKKVSCKDCTSELEIEVSDIMYVTQPGDRPGESSTDLFKVTCPVCTVFIYLSSIELPKGMCNFIKRNNANYRGISTYSDR